MVPYSSYPLHQAERQRSRAEQLAATQAAGQLAELVAALHCRLAQGIATATCLARAAWAPLASRASAPVSTQTPSPCVCPAAS